MQKLFVSGMLNYIIDYNYFILVWLSEFSYGNLEPMLAVVSMICGVATRACLAMGLHASSGYLFAFDCSADLCGSLPWTDHYFSDHNYLQFAYSVDLCGSLLWSPVLPIRCPALPTPHRKCFMLL